MFLFQTLKKSPIVKAKVWNYYKGNFGHFLIKFVNTIHVWLGSKSFVFYPPLLYEKIDTSFSMSPPFLFDVPHKKIRHFSWCHILKPLYIYKLCFVNRSWLIYYHYFTLRIYKTDEQYMNFSFQLVVPWILEAVVFLYTGVFPKFLKHVKIS